MVYGGLTGPWSPCSVVDSEFHKQVVRKEQAQDEKWAVASAVRDALLKSGSAATLNALTEAKLRRENSRGSLTRSNRSAKSTPSFASLTKSWSGHVPARYAAAPNHRHPPRAAGVPPHPQSMSRPPSLMARPRTPPPYRPPPETTPEGPGEHRYYASTEPYIPPWRTTSRSPMRSESPVPMGSGERMRSPTSRSSLSPPTIGPETARWQSTLFGGKPMARPPSAPLLLPGRSLGSLPPPKLASPRSAVAARLQSPTFVRPKPRRSTPGIALAQAPGGGIPSAPSADPFAPQGTGSSSELGVQPVPRPMLRPASALGGVLHLSDMGASPERGLLMRPAPHLLAMGV